MSIEIKESARPKKTSHFLVVFLAVCVGALVVINIIAIPETTRAQLDLKNVENAVATSEQLSAKREELARLFMSPRRKETKSALAQAVFDAKPKSALVFKAHPVWTNSKSFYLYSPDDSVSLDVQLDVWKSSDRINLKSKTGTERSEQIKIPLNAGQLHLFSFGRKGDSVRFQFDDREITTIQLPKSNSGGESNRSGEPIGLVGIPNTLSSHFFDFAAASEMALWKSISNVQFRQYLPSKTPGKGKGFGGPAFVVGVVASLSSTAPKHVSANQFLAANGDLKLEWDSKSKRYKILSIKSND